MSTSSEESLALIDRLAPPGSDLDSWGNSLLDARGVPSGGALQPASGPLLSEEAASLGLASLNSNLASRLTLSRSAMPEVGSTFLGFHLLAKLGQGAFGRVYLAQQPELANRLVALKVSAESVAESQRLAQLQHTHIVPIYSFHQAGPLQAVCMPYFGSATLADVLHTIQEQSTATGQHRIPRSGKDLVSTLQNRRSQTVRSLESCRSAMAEPISPSSSTTTSSKTGPVVVPIPANLVSLHRLEQLSYTEAILWLGARLADGLAHAHERGILHRDLKPANILLTDDGQPMLLDFNLAADVKQSDGAEVALIGGTLPYMSPEHLTAFDGQTIAVDHRSDLYALGLILTELLIGRLPFARHQGDPKANLPKMIAERLQGPTRHEVLRHLRRHNPAITPAIAAILGRCLEPDPAQRYQSARELQEDLERHLAHRPLKHTREPSLVERTSKFARRNPYLTSATTLALAAGLIITSLVVALVVRTRQVERNRVEKNREALTRAVSDAGSLFAASRSTPSLREQGEVLARQTLATWGALESDDPSRLPAALAPDEKTQVRGRLGELLLLMADTCAGPAEALALNERAARWFSDGPAPRAIHLHRASLLERMGRAREAAQARERAAASPVRSAWEQALVAREEIRQGQVARAVRDLGEVVRKEPGNVAAWHLLGNATLEAAANRLAQETDAISAYTVCLALTPGFAGHHINRGLAYLRLRRYSEAEADFSEALRLRPALAEVYLHRAQAWEGIGEPNQALADVNTAIRQGVTTNRAFATRARLRASLGEAAGSEQDRAEVLRRQPESEEDFIVRGVARLPTDIPAALADFEAAVRLNPRSVAGLNNQASIYSEKLDQPREAIARLDRVLKNYPNLAGVHASRGVLHARLGERSQALRDARQALTLDDGPETAYQVAGIYARLAGSSDESRYQNEALRLLSRALRQGYGLDLVEIDPDLTTLKHDPRRIAIAEAARLLGRYATPQPRVEPLPGGTRP